ncbi:NAD(P)H-binding protein [Rhizobium sp. YIM 134829]|uniref:NAD(P)H-binding protein n=1 Tax=Rhizobium sp. YIM 134829 TaxID=3390453 RepID=UPI00397B5505
MIVITGATGNIGGKLLEELAAGSEALRVVARHPEKLPPALLSRVEVVEGSHGDPNVAARAFEGADAVFWLVTGDPQAESAEAAYSGFTRPVLGAFETLKGKHVVTVSALGRGWPEPAGHVSATLAMDDLIAATGVHFRALTCPSLMENLLRQVHPLAGQGVFFGTLPADQKEPGCASMDVARTAAELLTNRHWTGVAEVPILGPDDLSCDQMAAILSDVLGRPIRYQSMPEEALGAQLLSYGASPGMAAAMVEMMIAKRHGIDRIVARTPEARGTTDFRGWCEAVLKPAVQAVA